MNKIIKSTEKGFYANFDAANSYDPNVDYNEVLNEYNRLVDEKNVAEALALLKKHGGIISLIGKIHYNQNYNR